MAQGRLPFKAEKRRGRHERKFDEAIAKLRRQRKTALDPLDEILVAGGRALTRQLDVAEEQEKPYATPALERELVVVYDRLKAGAGGADQLAQWLEHLDDDEDDQEQA